MLLWVLDALARSSAELNVFLYLESGLSQAYLYDEPIVAIYRFSSSAFAEDPAPEDEFVRRGWLDDDRA